MSKCSWTRYEGQKKTELTEQIRVMKYCESMEAYNEEYKLIYHIPNEGKRKQRTGKNLVKAGLKKGVPDLFISVSKFGYHGLYIELKKDKKSKVEAEQINWIKRLNQQKYIATVCYGADEAIELITAYIEEIETEFLKTFRVAIQDRKTGKIEFLNAKDNSVEYFLNTKKEDK